MSGARSPRWVLTAAVALGALALSVTVSAVALGKDYARVLLAGGDNSAGAPSGSYPVGRRTISVPVEQGSISIDIWYPAHAPQSSVADRVARAARQISRPAEAPSLPDAPFAETDGRWPLLVYHASGGQRRNDNTYMLANLASNGYVVAAFDEISFYNVGEPAVRNAIIEFQSDGHLALSLAQTAKKTELAARVASSVIDALSENPALDAVDTSVVGAVGYSFGGAVSAELSHIDDRIAAVVNIDGLTFGRAAAEGIHVPYLYISSNSFFTPKENLESANNSTRYEAKLALIETERLAEQEKRPANATFVATELTHTELGDRLVYPSLTAEHATKSERTKMWRSINTIILSFFDQTMSDTPDELVFESPLTGLIPFDEAVEIAAERGAIYP